MTANLRIVWDNAADRGQIAASSEVGNLAVANLRSDLKSKVWRGLTTNESVILQWDTREPVACIVFAFNNFTAGATMRVRGWEHATDLFETFDTGYLQCAPEGALGQFQWGAPLGENFYQRGGAPLFAYGFGGYGVIWLEGGWAVERLEVEVNDPNNPDGFVEAGRLIVGPYWTPLYNFDFGHSLWFEDSTKNTRTEAGDLRSEPGAKWRKVALSLSYMDAEDRVAVLRMARVLGKSKPLFLSMFPDSPDPMLEQSYQLWGKIVDSPKITNPQYEAYATQLEIEEV